jgi:MFS family permease
MEHPMADAAHPPRAALLRDPNFRWLMLGSAISLLGDQFTLIALPWLVLRMTGDTAALGLVLALVGVPRALFILIGGAVVDRFSPKRVLMLSKHANTVLLAALALGVHLQLLGLPAVCALALGIGLSTAFSYPAATSILPRVLPSSQLAAANGLSMGLRQLSFFAGPLAAGFLIALGGDGADGRGRAGIAVAFGADALSFALSAWTLARVATRAPSAAAQPAPAALWASVAQGLRHVWRDAQLRSCYLYWSLVALLVMGPMNIALPVLAESRPDFGASALGLMSGLHGAGTLLGMAVSGARPGLRLGTLGLSVLLADAAIGLLLMPLSAITSAWQGALLMGLIGLLGGFMQVAIFTWVQRRVPAAMLGRAMSLFMFIFMGLVPLASAASGWLLRVVTPTQLFTAFGAALLLVDGVAAVATPMRRVSDAPA